MIRFLSLLAITAFVLPVTPHVISALLYKSLPYDALKDFTPVALIASGPYALVVNPQRLAVGPARELVAAVKAQPGKIDYPSSGNGSAQHLVGTLFNSMAGVELNHEPYKGGGPAMQDLISGQVAVSFAGIPNVLGHVKSGRLRARGVDPAQPLRPARAARRVHPRRAREMGPGGARDRRDR